MKATVVQALIAFLLLAGGAVLLARGEQHQRLANAQQALLTLRYDQAVDNEGTRAAAEYWRRNYDAVPRDADPLLAANAAYRAAMDSGGPARDVVGRLDAVIKQYADVLRSDPDNEAAAYNYEFAVRYRAAVAARGLPVAAAVEDGTATPHGAAGGPPAGGETKQFKMMVPMRPDERQEAEEAGRAGRRVRKG
jgi:hypothetical protein